MSTPTEGSTYLVSKGGYSSYRVVGLYTNEALADRAACSLGITADGEDGMIKRNGHIYRSREVTAEQETRVMDNGFIIGEVWARDKEHAIKIMARAGCYVDVAK